MDFSTNSSSPARIPAFEARFNPQYGQDLSLERLLDEANGNSNIQYAAGGVRSSPLAPTCPPSVSIPFDQLRALLSTYLSTEVNAGRGFGLPNSNSPFNASSLGSELSSSSSSPPPSSITSPTGDELPLSFDLPFHDPLMNDQDPAVPLQAFQYPLALSFPPNVQSYPTPPKQLFFQPVTLPEDLSTANVPITADQSVGIDNIGAFTGSDSSLAVPSFSETTALGLYYPSAPQSLYVPPLSIQVNAPTFPALPPPAEARKVRAATPTVKASRAKYGRNGKSRRPPDVVAALTSAASGTGEEPKLKCRICGFTQTTQRKGDLQRHMRIHGDPKLNRYVCCGIPASHSAAADLMPGHSVRLYKGRAFYGGCGNPYSRMDALQRHSRDSGCASGSAKEHKLWRRFYL